MGAENDLRDRAFRLLGYLVTRMDPGRLEAWAGLGLTMTQLRVLFMLRADEGLSAGALAERLSVTPSTLTRIMDRLVRNHLVRREVGPDDRRLVRHFLTEQGLRTVAELERMGRERAYRMFDRLSQEQLRSLIEALEHLVAAADEIAARERGEGVGV
jgi:DNA-binding MarR family transcriptional regulator